MMNEDYNRVLVVDDEPNMRHMMSALLTNAGWIVEVAAEGEEALLKLSRNRFHFILCDIRMPGMDGITFMKTAGKRLNGANVIMMSAYGTIVTAVEAMKLGAYDYISKPFKPDEVLLVLNKAREREILKHENSALKQRIQEIEGGIGFGKMMAKSKSMLDLFKLAARVAQYDTTVLITGESGTGKELVARGIHFSGMRAGKNLIPINCAGIPQHLLESELFGYKKGAFTGADRDYGGLFEAAEGGTLFLDEIGDLPLALQVKLLRVLQESEIRPVGSSKIIKVDVRIIAATSRDLESEIKNGNFREDLFYRLNVLRIHIPPLVERTEDIPLLCGFFIDRYSRKCGKEISGIAPAAMSLLLSHHWPGNVRELENMIERAVVMSETEELQLVSFPGIGKHGSAIGSQSCDILSGFSLKMGKEVLERTLIRKALTATGGNRTHAARLLEISHPSLLSKIKLYGIET